MWPRGRVLQEECEGTATAASTRNCIPAEEDSRSGWHVVQKSRSWTQRPKPHATPLAPFLTCR